ncbi:MAG: alkaline phosphatase family protein [Acidobacteriota bacterium]|nr:alkaline phosphatase family protein [Acidobacteriota bacterium]
MPKSRPVLRLFRDLAYNAVPGVLAGAQAAGLLFFLNPKLPFGPLSFFRASTALAALLGLVSAAVLSLFTWRWPGRAQRLLPWTLTLVLAAAAVSDWTHASYFAFLVPKGINVRLIKAAIWLTVAALIAFYTALLHSFPKRRYGRGSVLALVLVSVASVSVLLERRDAFRPSVRPEPLASMVVIDPGPGLMVVGLQGATLDAILPLAQQGQLPFFAELIDQGTHARLSSFSPPSASALWTSVATGKPPYRHGILGDYVSSAAFLGGADLRILPAGPFFPRGIVPGLSFRPFDARLRDSLALWEVDAVLGRLAGVVGWPATHPTKQPLAFAFSDRYFRGDFSVAAALPPELAERGVLFQVGYGELDASITTAFGEEVPLAVLRMLADDVWRESLALFLLDQRQDLSSIFLLLPGLSEVSRLYFGGYAAFQFDGVQAAGTKRSAQIITAYYRHLDSYLAELWARQDDPKILAVVSPFGVEAPTGWRRAIRALSRRPLHGVFHPTSDGILFLRGAGIQPGNFLSDATILDVAPTLLYGMGRPVSRDLEGRVLVSAFEPSFLARTPLTYVPSYETTARVPPIRESTTPSTEEY